MLSSGVGADYPCSAQSIPGIKGVSCRLFGTGTSCTFLTLAFTLKTYRRGTGRWRPGMGRRGTRRTSAAVRCARRRSPTTASPALSYCIARTYAYERRPFSPRTPSCARSRRICIRISALLSLLFSAPPQGSATQNTEYNQHRSSYLLYIFLFVLLMIFCLILLLD